MMLRKANFTWGSLFKKPHSIYFPWNTLHIFRPTNLHLMSSKRTFSELPVPKEVKKKIKTKTDEITMVSHANYNQDLTTILEGKRNHDLF